MMQPQLLILPGLGNSGAGHWQTHWQRMHAGSVRLEQENWDAPICSEWVESMDAFVKTHPGPYVIAAHSSSCALVAHWASGASGECLGRIRGALLVAPSDPDGPNYPRGPKGFGPVLLRRLPFPSIVVASSNDPYVHPAKARRFASAWQSDFVLVEDAGHINAASGHGPWPEGLALVEGLLHGRGMQNRNDQASHEPEPRLASRPPP